MTTCRACRSDRLDEVFSMDPMPLAGGFAATVEEARSMPRYPLAWLLCHDCGLVNVSPDIPDDLIYRTYSYAASTVPSLVRHHAEFARVLTARYGPGTDFLEIGCNDGVLLNQLPREWNLCGIDPSDVALAAHRALPYIDDLRHYELWDEPMTDDVFDDNTFDVVTSSNAFAHFSDIAGALDGVARVLKPGGEFWIEVHDLISTLRSGQWDTIYHEHKVEWSVEALIRNLADRGLYLRRLSIEPLHGGLIRAVFGRTETMAYPFWDWTPDDFAPLRDAYANRKRPPLMAHSAAYGAAARATVYLNQMGALPIDYIVDGSPLRAGKFVPGLGIPVLGPEVFEADRPETTLITAWNHAADIRAKHPGYDGWVTAW
jgi:SAM-dependent methyltransferase